MPPLLLSHKKRAGTTHSFETTDFLPVTINDKGLQQFLNRF